ncbi:MAG TPA: small ribosomal subunit Rsm22 family protein [Kofleriaceae bacterium]|nr:small ribosomal subunit Rsm22 family protein [Kofleriaceae bacterium]
MIWTVPVELEDAVYAAARSVVGDAALAAGPLGRAIVDRSRRYTSERERLAEHAAGDLAARAAFFTIADAIKIAIPLAELAGRGALPARSPLRVVDLGAGCGAMSLGLVASLPPRELELLAIDRDSDALRIATAALRDLAARRGFALDVTARVAEVASTAIPRADLVVLGSVLNELPAAARVPLVERALAVLADDGALIAIEPALRDTARALHDVRDAMVARGAHVFAPCTRTAAPCTALADPDDWCHEHRTLALPPRTAELARTTHLRDSGLKLAYLVLRRAPLPLVPHAGALRVVSAPHAAKGKLELVGCGDAGRVDVRLLRRHRTDANRAFEDARRGDVIVVEPAPTGERLELAAETRVRVVKPAG